MIAADKKDEWELTMERCRQWAEDNPERAHSSADELLLEILRHHGYGDICDSFKAMERWYA